ncbi:MAG: hypothetical protein O2971_01835 [Proteobacteria bacterium]|nr:hypothetical protein [Pseudomonadota bacterium]
MHDAIIAERLGIPALAVMTTKFVTAADLMAKVLGLSGYKYCTIAHPISSATTDELRQRAETVIDILPQLIVEQGV